MTRPAIPSRRELFISRMVEWLNIRLVPEGFRVNAETRLFEDGLIDSLRILELIAWTEREIGQEIPDVMIRMDNFHTVARIAEAFVTEESSVAG